MPLTDIAVRTARARDKAYRLTDGGNMYLFVNTRGGRYWRMDYRFEGRRDMLAFGVYPGVSLADARAARSEAQRLLKQGIDPKAQRKLDKLVASVAAANTFKELGEEWQAKRKREGKAEATLAKDRWLLNDYAYPWIGHRPIGDIKAPELLAVLKRAEDKGVLETAGRLRSLCGRIFRYGIATGRGERDPSADLRDALTAPKVTHRAALLTPKAVGGLIRSIRGFDGQAITKAALQLAALTFVRPGELRHAEWAEFDLKAQLWRIPAEKMKMREAHIVPLSTQAVERLRALHSQTGHGRYLFPSIRSTKRVMSENTVNAALRRLGYGKDEMTGHGFRRIASTLLNEKGFNRDWIERQLAHSEGDEIRAAYNAAQYLTERKGMMQAWADYLDELASQVQRIGANVADAA